MQKNLRRKQKSQGPNKGLLTKHYKACRDAFKQILQTPISSLITCTVMAMTILLTTTMLMTLKSLGDISHFLHKSNSVTVYLKTSTQDNDILLWKEKLSQEPIVREVTYISPEQALKDLADSMEYQNILAEVPENPLPPVLLIKLKPENEQSILSFTTQLKTSPLVSAVNVDFDWIKRLTLLLKLGNRITYTLTILFVLGVIFIISHAIQGATERNHEEMKILLLMGASTAYLKRPFLYLGLLLGIGASLVTLFLLVLLFLPLKQPLCEIMQIYQLSDDNLLFNFSLILKVCTISIILGWVGAWLAFYRSAKIYHLI